MGRALIFMLSVALAIPLPVNAGVFGPSSYEECIEESLKGVGSDVAAKALILNCRQKFPTKEELANRKQYEERIKQEEDDKKKAIERQDAISKGKKSSSALPKGVGDDLRGGLSVLGLCTDEMESCTFSIKLQNETKGWYITSVDIEVIIEGCSPDKKEIRLDLEPSGFYVTGVPVGRCAGAKYNTNEKGNIIYKWYLSNVKGFYLPS